MMTSALRMKDLEPERILNRQFIEWSQQKALQFLHERRVRKGLARHEDLPAPEEVQAVYELTREIALNLNRASEPSLVSDLDRSQHPVELAKELHVAKEVIDLNCGKKVMTVNRQKEPAAHDPWVLRRADNGQGPGGILWNTYKPGWLLRIGRDGRAALPSPPGLECNH